MLVSFGLLIVPFVRARLFCLKSSKNFFNIESILYFQILTNLKSEKRVLKRVFTYLILYISKP